jgi:hypothetical protein
MFLVGPYLFSGDALDLYLADRFEEAVNTARAVPAKELQAKGRNTVMRELHAKFAIPVTNLHVDEAFFTNERPLTAEEGESIGAPAEDLPKFKSLSISIPYSGDEHLFTCTPTIYSAHQPQAEVKDGKLNVVYFLNEVEEYQLENNFKRLVALIERTLEVTQWQAMAFNERLAEALAGALPQTAGA